MLHPEVRSQINTDFTGKTGDMSIPSVLKEEHITATILEPLSQVQVIKGGQSLARRKDFVRWNSGSLQIKVCV